MLDDEMKASKISLPKILTPAEQIAVTQGEYLALIKKQEAIQMRMESEFNNLKTQRDEAVEEVKELREQVKQLLAREERDKLEETQRFKVESFIRPIASRSNTNVRAQPKNSLLEAMSKVKPPSVKIDMFLSAAPQVQHWSESELQEQFKTWWLRFQFMTAYLTEYEKVYMLIAKIGEPVRT